MNTAYVGRFAPSPTGPLHFGSIVAALASWLDARAAGGRWHLRIEDLDTARCSAVHATDIIQTLRAFGLDWDGEIVWQHTRTQSYAVACEQLWAKKALYACVCSRREIADSGTPGIDGPVYPGTCRNADLPLAAHAWRLRTTDASLVFQDRVQGTYVQNVGAEVGDFVLRRRDGVFAYQLAVVVDDAALGVTHVVRGADLLDSTARQIFLQRVLQLPTPHYAHIPVLVNALGQKLSKQTLAPAVSTADALAVLRHALHFLGQSPPEAASSPADLLRTAALYWRLGDVPQSRSLPAT